MSLWKILGLAKEKTAVSFTCPYCNGAGYLTAESYQEGEVFGQAAFECDTCLGLGIIYDA